MYRIYKRDECQSLNNTYKFQILLKYIKLFSEKEILYEHIIFETL